MCDAPHVPHMERPHMGTSCHCYCDHFAILRYRTYCIIHLLIKPGQKKCMPTHPPMHEKDSNEVYGTANQERKRATMRYSKSGIDQYALALT